MLANNERQLTLVSGGLMIKAPFTPSASGRVDASIKLMLKIVSIHTDRVDARVDAVGVNGA